MEHIISCEELNQRPRSGVVVIDVMTPEDYAAGHLPGAYNACVYEMVFLERVAQAVADRSTALVLYDASATSCAAETACERLLQAGYANVSILAGGLNAWRQSGLPVDVDDGNIRVVTEIRDSVYRLDTVTSRVEWIGRNINNRHHGRIALLDGELTIRNGLLFDGTVVADMASISNLDLLDEGWRSMLIRHLMSDDFFAVERFPTAHFRLTGWEALGDAGRRPPEATQGVAVGELTIRDVTRVIRCLATLVPQSDGALKAHALFEIDRTLWNVCYGSARFFERLGMHLVSDIITLELFVEARPV